MSGDDGAESGRRPGPWVAGAAVLHERVLAVVVNRLTARLVELHAPVDDGGEQPVCSGCDQAAVSDDMAMWPCRTYTLIAASALGLGPGGVEEYLTALRAGRQPHRDGQAADRPLSSGVWPDTRAGSW